MRSAIRHYADVLTSVVGHLLKRGTDQAVVATVRVALSANTEGVPSQCLFIHVACTAPSAYVNVFVAVTSRPTFGPDFVTLPWQKVCSHDSAWRDDGVRSALKNCASALYAVARATSPNAEWDEYLNLDQFFLVPSAACIPERAAGAEVSPLDATALVASCMPPVSGAVDA